MSKPHWATTNSPGVIMAMVVMVGGGVVAAKVGKTIIPPVTVASTFHTQDLIVGNTARTQGRVSICASGVDGCLALENKSVFDPNAAQHNINSVPQASVFTVLRHDHVTGLLQTQISQAQETIADGTYDATANGTLAVAVEADALGTKSAGAFVHQNIGIFANAKDGDENYAIYSNYGDIRTDPASTAQLGNSILTSIVMSGGGPANLSSATSIQLNTNITSIANEFTGDSTHTPIVAVGNTPITDGTGIQVKNTSAAQAISGIDMLADTSINANQTTGIFMTRGAGGGGGASGNNPAGMALIGNAGSVLVGAAVGDLAIYDQVGGGAVVFGANLTGFRSATRLTKANHWAQDTSTGTPSPSAACTNGGGSTIVGNDNRFEIVMGAGSTACVITFVTTWTLKPMCTVTPQGGIAFPNVTPAAGTYTFTTNANSGDYVVDCQGQQGGT